MHCSSTVTVTLSLYSTAISVFKFYSNRPNYIYIFLVGLGTFVGKVGFIRPHENGKFNKLNVEKSTE